MANGTNGSGVVGARAPAFELTNQFPLAQCHAGTLWLDAGNEMGYLNFTFQAARLQLGQGNTASYYAFSVPDKLLEVALHCRWRNLTIHMVRNLALEALVGTTVLTDLGDVAKTLPIQEKQSRGVSRPASFSVPPLSKRPPIPRTACYAFGRATFVLLFPTVSALSWAAAEICLAAGASSGAAF